MRLAAAVRLRQGPALGAPHRSRGRGRRGTRLGLAAHPDPPGRARPGARGELHRPGRRAGPVRVLVDPVAPGAAAGGRPGGGAGHDDQVLDRVVVPVHLPGAVPGRGDPVADHAQGAHLRPDRRDSGRAHDLAARGHRRGAELGLPLLLAARRHDHARGTAAHRLHRGSLAVAGVARPRDRRGPARRADHVRRGRRAQARGMAGRVAARLRELGPGADRQRRREPVAARRVRRGDRRDHARPAGGPDLRQPHLEPGPQAAAVPRAVLGPARRGHLGGARAAPGTSCTPR